MRENLERNFGFLVNDVARLLRTTFDRRVRALGLTRSQWWVLTHLFRQDGITQSDLAEILDIEKATLGRLLDRMEAKNLVRRQIDDNDRRAKRVYLTAEVEPSVQTMRAIAAEMRRDALSGLSRSDREQFVDSLITIKANLARLNESGASKSATPKGGTSR